METTNETLKKEVKFVFENKDNDGNNLYVIADILDFNPDEGESPFAGTHSDLYPERCNISDPQEWMDSYNDWDIEEGNEVKKIYGQCISYSIYIDEAYLREKLEEAAKEVENFSWSGWGVALHLHKDNEITISSIISNNTWSESDDFFEIFRMQSWNVDYSLEQYLTEIKNCAYNNQEKRILKELEQLEDNGELEYENLSEEAQADYDDAYDTQTSEDIDTIVDYAIEEMKNDEIEHKGVNYIISH